MPLALCKTVIANEAPHPSGRRGIYRENRGLHSATRVRTVFTLLLFDRATRQTIRHIQALKVERPSVVVAAAGVELRSMVSEGEKVFRQKTVEAAPRCIEM